MQKVVGSSPIIRFAKRPANAGFLLSGAATHPAAWQQNGNGRAASSDPGVTRPAVEPIDFDAYVDVLRQRFSITRPCTTTARFPTSTTS